MKYVKEAILKSKAKYTAVLDIIFSIISMIINTYFLIWMSSAIENYEDPMFDILRLLIATVVTILCNAITSWTRGMSTHYVYVYLYNKFTEKVCSCDYDVFTSNSPGDLITTSQNIWQISGALNLALSAVKNLSNFIITAIAMICIEPKLLILIGIIYPIGGIITYKAFKKWTKFDEKVDEVKRKRNRELDEIINGFNEVRSTKDSGKIHYNSIRDQNKEFIDSVGARTKHNMNTNLFIVSIDSMMTMLVIVLLIYLLQTNGITSTSVAITLVVYSWRLVDPLVYFIDCLSQVSELKAPLPKFVKIMNYQNQVLDGTENLDEFSSDIQFQNVSFQYDKSHEVLKDINFTIYKGEHVGVCGTTGEGKSTLLKLIPRFYDPTQGYIKIDRRDIRKYTLSSLRSHIGIVHQEPYIWDKTIRENIIYPASNSDISDEQIYEACKRASIYDFIANLPDKFETNVGPRGLKLSGGQKQRIALARLFISNPDIIILDEATSSLDTETEKFVQDSLNAFRDKTMIVVAHRLSTIKNSDVIYVIDDHTILEHGSHDELISLKGKYYSMYSKDM